MIVKLTVPLTGLSFASVTLIPIVLVPSTIVSVELSTNAVAILSGVAVILESLPLYTSSFPWYVAVYVIWLPSTGVYSTWTVPSSSVVTSSSNNTWSFASTIVTCNVSPGTWLSTTSSLVLFLKMIVAFVELWLTGLPDIISTVVLSFATLNVSSASTGSYPLFSAGVNSAVTVTSLVLLVLLKV